MKVLFDLTALADNFSGIERYALCISSEYIRQFPENEYILMFKNEVHFSYKSIVRQNNIRTIVLKGSNKLVFNQIILPWNLYRIKADAYVFLAFPEPVLFFRRNIYTALHDACCWDCGETMKTTSKWYFRISHLHAMLFSKRIITISEFSKQRICNVGLLKPEKVAILYCGTDSKFTPSETMNDGVRQKYNLPNRYFLTLSTIEPRKNLSLLLKAYTRCIENGMDVPVLVLAGRKGWKMDSLLESYSDEVKRKLHFTGFIDDEDLPDVYRGAEWFIFPSKYEGFGIPPLEAMACGTPVVSSDAASLPEILGDAAVYFESENEELLVRLMSDITSFCIEEYDRLKVAGIARAAVFDWKKEAQKLSWVLEH